MSNTLPPSAPYNPPAVSWVKQKDMNWGANALTAPTTPGNRLPVVDKSQVDPQMRKAAEGMEAMFLDYLMKVMRQTVPKNEMDLESPATEVYRSLHDSEVAQTAARTGGVGLADQIIAYMQAQRYSLPKGSNELTPAVPKRTGGTYEGKPE